MLYQSDSYRGVIVTWDWHADSGTVSNQCVFAHADEALGRPDGAAVDIEGCYWSAGVSAGVLNRFTPDGALVQRMRLPVRFPTMPAFGGKGLQTLYVTSLVRKEVPANDLDGRLLALTRA